MNYDTAFISANLFTVARGSANATWTAVGRFLLGPGTNVTETYTFRFNLLFLACMIEFWVYFHHEEVARNLHERRRAALITLPLEMQTSSSMQLSIFSLLPCFGVSGCMCIIRVCQNKKERRLGK